MKLILSLHEFCHKSQSFAMNNFKADYLKYSKLYPQYYPMVQTLEDWEKTFWNW